MTLVAPNFVEWVPATDNIVDMRRTFGVDNYDAVSVFQRWQKEHFDVGDYWYVRYTTIDGWVCVEGWLNPPTPIVIPVDLTPPPTER